MLFAMIKNEFKVNEKYIFYAVFLRFMAAILITNSHYSNVYPISIIASGGLLGDVLFFSISGFGLAFIKGNFVRWYKKRILRIYPAVLIITIFYFVSDYYFVDPEYSKIYGVIRLFLYPTYYHFVASIVILYIFYYFIMKFNFLRAKIPYIILLVAFFQLIYYLIYVDYSYYHIDNVRESFIRFIFLESMLIGAYFRIYKPSFKIHNILFIILTFVLMLIYFISKNVFVMYEQFSFLQILNQYILVILLFMIFYVASQFEISFKNMPIKIKNIINFIATITLEIYLVQYVIIDIFNPLVFPINWGVITLLIVFSAFLLHISVLVIKYLFNKAFNKEISVT